MVSLMILIAMARQEDSQARSPSIYRCTYAEGETQFFAAFVGEDSFDTACVTPKPGPKAIAAAKGNVKFIAASKIDTKTNLAWRNATIEFVNGKISPKTWLARTKNLHETVHFLSSPKTPALRPITGADSHRAVFAEMLVCSLPGRPCFTSGDIGHGDYLPGPGRLESWLLAMNDWLGPMLAYRHSEPYLVTGKPKIIRADAKPGLLIFSQTNGKKTITFYLNNAQQPVELPPFNEDKLTINIGLNIDDSKPKLLYNSFMIVES